MSDPPEIRVLEPGAIAEFRAMLDFFGRVFDEPDSYVHRQPGDSYIADRLADPAFSAIVALAGDEIVGALAAYELPKFEQERSEIYIYDLAVDAGHRRQGIATALIDKVREIARSRGAWVIFVQADTGEEDAAAIALYSKLGRREEVLHFDIDPADE